MTPPPEKALHVDLTRSILDSAIQVQDALGVGLFEKPYKVCLAHSLRQKGHQVLTEVALDITFEGLLISDAYKIDLLVDDKVVVEAKTVDRLNAMHQAQVLTYLRLSSKEVGLLLNFWASPLKDGGIQRLIRTQGGRAGNSVP
jgi:iron complex transport system substrate-binding protein